MAWTVGVVAALVVTLITSAVRGEDGNILPSNKTEILLLKPTADYMNITVLAQDRYGYRGFTVSLQGACFPAYSPWHFTQVSVTKENYMKIHLNLTVGACEVNCNGEYRNQDYVDDKSGLKSITVIPNGLENYTTPGDIVNPDDYPIKFTNCTEGLAVKIDQTLSCPCTNPTNASPETDQNRAPPSKTSSTPSTSPSSTSPTAGLSGSNNASPSTSPSPQTNHSLNTKPYRGNPTLDKILMGALAVQVLGTAVMAVIVTVVIRRASRVTTIVCLETDEEQQDKMSAAAAVAAANHPREHD